MKHIPPAAFDGHDVCDPATRRRTDLTMSDFRAFLESKPRDEVYHYISVENCALGQYLQHKGATYADLHLSATPRYEGPMRSDDCPWHAVARPVSDRPTDTFGRAARRARIVEAGGWRLRLARFIGWL